MRKQTLVRAKTRVAAAMFAAAMTVGSAAAPIAMTVPVMAETEIPTGTIEVINCEAGATVSAYQLVKGVYTSDNKLNKYEITALGTAADSTISLTDLIKAQQAAGGNTWTPDNTTKLAAWATAAANLVQGNSSTYTASKSSTIAEGSTKWSAAVEPGLYLVLVTGTGGTVYNPVLLSVSVTDANKLEISGSSVDLNTAFQNGTNTAYLKKSSTGFDKRITNIQDGVNNNSSTKAEGKGDALAIGDTAEFRIDNMTVPSYSADYKNVTYMISDTLEATGFEGITDLAISTADDSGSLTVIDAKNYTIGETVSSTVGDDDKLTWTADTEFASGTSKKFVVAFSDSFIRENAGKKIVITYKAKLATTAGVNYAENYNHAVLTYTNSPIEGSDGKCPTTEEVKNTYHYTFGIDASIDSETLDGTNNNTNWETHEINKVTTASTEDAYGVKSTTYSQTVTNGNTKKSTSALYGAGFTLYTDEACTTKAKAIVNTTTKNGDNAATYTKGTSMVDAVATSDENGHISFIGLDEGTYYMKETEAPSGYTLDSHVYKIVIDGTFDETTGIMTSYSITTYRGIVTNGKFFPDATVGAATYKNDSNTVANDGSVTTSITSTQTAIIPAEIVDTPLQNLPFTGGKGRYAVYFTAVGLAGVCGILFTVKKKSEQSAE